MITTAQVYDVIVVTHPKVIGVNYSDSVFTLRFAEDATQPEIDAANNALPGVIADLEAQEAAHAANQAALADMIATFVVSAAAIDYFNALQQDIRSVSNNNSINIATVFPAMRTLLQTDATLYNRYLNLLRVATGIDQVTFEGSPTTAQQRNAFIVALDFANIGMIQMIAGVLFG